MPIHIVKKEVSSTEYELNLSTYVPCCDLWQGFSVKAMPDGSGIFPDGLFKIGRRGNQKIYVPFQFPIKYCPNCGQPFQISITDSDGNVLEEIESNAPQPLVIPQIPDGEPLV